MDEETPDLMLAPTPDTLYEAMQAALVVFGQQAPRHDPEYEKHKRRRETLLRERGEARDLMAIGQLDEEECGVKHAQVQALSKTLQRE